MLIGAPPKPPALLPDGSVNPAYTEYLNQGNFGHTFAGGVHPQVVEDQARDALAIEISQSKGSQGAVLGDKTIDTKTREQLIKLYQSGGSSQQITDVLNQAREGKGIYGVRRTNENQQIIKRIQPGRQQVLSLGSGSVIG
jgi:hypothetical protein